MSAVLSQTRPRRLLVVDHSCALITLVEHLAESAGWTHDAARDGFEAICRLSAETYDAVLLDNDLPGMTGIEVMRWISRNLSRPPAVFVHSPERSGALQRDFGGLGVRAFLPNTPTALVAALESTRDLRL